MINTGASIIRVIDFHSHILPFMDDGSKSTEESIEMLKLLRSQGVDAVVATPHFYAKREDPESFLRRRSESMQILRSAIEFSGIDRQEIPEIYVGAEVAYFNGMSKFKGMAELCVEGTNVMLLEMPFCKWSDAVVNEVCDMQYEHGVQIVLAHIDRYARYTDNIKLLKLRTHRVISQLNANAFLSFFSLRSTLKKLRGNMIHVLGSDCHNMYERPSYMDEALEEICSHGYEQRLETMMKKAGDLLEGATPLL